MDLSDILYFSLLGGGEGQPEEPGIGGGGFYWKSQEMGGGEGPGGCLWGIGGVNIFFGAEAPTKRMVNALTGKAIRGEVGASQLTTRLRN